MKKSVIVRSSFEARHAWLGCPFPEVAFLQFPHRHLFYVEVKVSVSHSNREVEFFILKGHLDSYLDTLKGKDLGSLSCEMIAEAIGEFLVKGTGYIVVSVKVFEDNENGAEVEF